MYQRVPDGSFRAAGLDALSLIGGRIARIVAFNDPALMTTFGLPETIPERHLSAAAGTSGHTLPDPDELSLLAEATRYLLGACSGFASPISRHRTPCPDWDLRGLLRHVPASLGDVTDVLAVRRTAPKAGPGPNPARRSGSRPAGRRSSTSSSRRRCHRPRVAGVRSMVAPFPPRSLSTSARSRWCCTPGISARRAEFVDPFPRTLLRRCCGFHHRLPKPGWAGMCSPNRWQPRQRPHPVTGSSRCSAAGRSCGEPGGGSRGRAARVRAGTRTGPEAVGAGT